MPAEEDTYDFFDSSLETLFGQHQPANGREGEKRRLELSKEIVLEYRIPAIQNVSNHRLFAHYQWDAGVYLARALSLSARKEGISSAGALFSKIQIKDKLVLELGAGTGLPALTCAALGAKLVLLTDYPDKGIIEALEENIKLCGVQANSLARGLDWTAPNQINAVAQKTQGTEYDVLLCADLLWQSNAHDSLLHAITSLLARCDTSRVLVVSGFHTGRRTLTRFFRSARQQGLVRDWEDPHGGVSEYDVINSVSRPWSGTVAFPDPFRHGHSTTEARHGEELDDNMDDHVERAKWLLFVSLRWDEEVLSAGD